MTSTEYPTPGRLAVALEYVRACIVYQQPVVLGEHCTRAEALAAAKAVSEEAASKLSFFEDSSRWDRMVSDADLLIERLERAL